MSRLAFCVLAGEAGTAHLLSSELRTRGARVVFAQRVGPVMHGHHRHSRSARSPENP